LGNKKSLLSRKLVLVVSRTVILGFGLRGTHDPTDLAIIKMKSGPERERQQLRRVNKTMDMSVQVLVYLTTGP
jgi:hypothetical protein